MIRHFAPILIAVLVAGPAAAFDPTQYGSPTYNKPQVDQLIIQGQGSTGDASTFCVKVLGSSKCRPERDRAADTINVLDRDGVDRTGATDSTAGLTNAITAAGAAGTGMEIPGGQYRLDGIVPSPAGVPTFLKGARFSGSGGLTVPDYSPFLTGPVTGWIRTTSQPGTEFGIISALTVQPTNSAAPYQKGAAYFSALNSDPSSFPSGGSSITRDVVGLQSTCTIAVGNMVGRCWGGASYAVAAAGSAGSLVGWEADVMNYSGVSQPMPHQPNSKTGISSVIYGGTGTTAFSAEANASAKWYRGFVAEQDKILNAAFGVLQAGQLDTWLFKVDPGGALSATTVTTSGAISATGGLYGTSAAISGPVGFNGATPVGKCTLPAALPADGSASGATVAAAINALRSCLITAGLAQ